MSIQRAIDPSGGWDDQVGLRLGCSADEARAIHRALRALFRGRMSPVFPSRGGGLPFTILVPATEQDLAQRWDEVLRLAGLSGAPGPAAPPPAAAPAQGAPAPPAPAPSPHTSTARERRPGDPSTWEQRFRAALKVVLDSESRATSPAVAAGATPDSEDLGEDGDDLLLASLPPASRLRARVARYALRGRHEQIVALCAQRRQEVLALPASELLVSQLLDAHLGEARRLSEATLAAAGRDLALAFLPELERLRQADGVRARLRQAEEAGATGAGATPATLAEQIAALISVAPAERLGPLGELRGRYPAAAAVRVALADAHAALGDVERALELYRSGRAADDVVDRVAELLLSVGRPREALAELEGRGELSSRLAGLRGAALIALGETSGARPLLERAWGQGERSAPVALAYARALASAGDLEGAAEPYQLALEATPDALGADDLWAMVEIAAGAGYGILSGEEEAAYLDRYIERAGRRLRERPDATAILRRRVELRRAAEVPERLQASLADWLEHLAERGDREQLSAAMRQLGALRREGAVSLQGQFDLLEGVEPIVAGAPGGADLLALEYQSIAVEELVRSLRQGRPMPAYVADLRRALHFLSRELADDLTRAIEAERQALTERSMAAPTNDVEASPAASLAGVRLAIVGGHVAMRREVEAELRERHGLVEYTEVAPSSEAHVDRDLVRDRTTGRDLVVVVAGYTGHDLTGHVRDLQRAGEIAGRVIWPRCRGKSGVVREILESATKAA